MPIQQATPITVEPSGKFLGPEGSWSTFLVNLGTPPQSVDVLASTQLSVTWVVGTDGCVGITSTNCTAERGGDFDWKTSSSWKGNNVYPFVAEANLGYTGASYNGTYGFDDIGFPGAPSASNASVPNQVVAYYTFQDFWVGNLGIGAQNTSFSDSATSFPSLITSLKSQGSIPSQSFGFTAGASYNNSGVNASLTLGGYDSSRFIPNDVVFTFGPTSTRQLVVNVQAITYSDSKTTTPLLSGSSINALVDSTVTHFWLPLAACQAFEKAFGISWDPLNNLYTVNDTLHSSLLKTNPSVSFQLSNSASGPAVNITLPYASFDMEATYPRVNGNATRFFPLQRANDQNTVTLGRAFLQEAYLIVDYDRGNFSISQSAFNSNTPSRVLAINAPQSSSTSSPVPSGVTVTQGNGSQSGGSHGISSGAIAGIVIAIVVVALCLVGGFWFFRRRKNRERRSLAELPPGVPPAEKAVDGDDAKDNSFESDESPDKLKYTAASPAPPYPMSPMSEVDGDPLPTPGSQSKPSELPGEHLPRSTYTTPGPLPTSELAAPGEIPIMRSQLSTPDPMYSSPELPAQDMRQEMPSPVPSANSAGSPKMSSSAFPTDNRPIHSSLPQQPSTAHADSPEPIYTGFTHDGMNKRFGGTTRTDTNASESSRKPGNIRRDSKESGISQLSLSSLGSPILPFHQPPLATGAERPPHQPRVDSNDSTTWQNRLEVSSASSGSDVGVERSQQTTSTTTTNHKTTTESIVRSNSAVAQGKRPEGRPQ